jgi:Uma2 family endonuclease
MAKCSDILTMTAYTIDFSSVCQISDEQFYQLCRKNPEIKFERNATGELMIMSPTGGETGNRNIEIAGDFVFWNRQNKLGKLFDSSTCFKLPNGANRSPDIAWIKLSRWDELTPEEKEKLPPIAPDFVLELMSPSDSLKATQAKMQEYMENQVKLAWLIDRKNLYVEIYRLEKSVEAFNSATTLFGEDVLPGFILDLKMVWS